MEDNEKEDFFFDKRDGNYTKIISDYKFLDIFGENSRKCKNVLIPETILVQGGHFKNWLFNSQKEPGYPILKRKADRLTTSALITYFSRTVLNQEVNNDYDSLYDTRQQKPVAFVHYISDQTDLFTINDLAEYLHEKLGVLRIIQIPLNVSTKSENYSNENYLVECRQDIATNPPQYRYYKKIKEVLSFHKFPRCEQNISSKYYQPKLLFGKGRKIQNSDATPELEKSTGLRGSQYSNAKQSELQHEQSKIYKLVDANFNKRLETPTKIVTAYIQLLFGVVVKKLVARFVQDTVENIYLLGIEQLYVEIGIPPSIKDKESQQLERNTPYMLNLPDLKQFNSNQKDNKRVSTAASGKGMINGSVPTSDKCQGDFCAYVHYDNLNFRAALKDPMHSLLHPGQRYKFMDDEEVEEPLKLPFEISYHLIKRCREMPDAITDILKQRKIYPKSDISRIQECMLQGRKVDFSVQFKKVEAERFQSLYRFVRVCKNCYSTYVCITKTVQKNQADGLGLVLDEAKQLRSRHPERKRQDAFNSSLSMKNYTSLTVLDPVQTTVASKLPALKPETTRENARSKSQQRFTKTSSSGLFTTSSRLGRKIDISASSQRLTLGVCSILPTSKNEKTAQQHLLGDATTLRSSSSDFRRPYNLFDFAQSISNISEFNKEKSLQARPKTVVLIDPEERVKHSDSNHRDTISVIASNVKRSSLFDPFNLRKSRASVTIRSPDLIKRASIIPPSMMSSLSDQNIKRILSKRKAEPYVTNDVQTLYHHTGLNVRNIPYFRITTPKMSLREKLNPSITQKPSPSITLDAVCNLAGYPLLPRNMPPIEMFIVDEHTAIPYLIITSPSNDPNTTNDVIIVCNDLFDNFTERLDYFQYMAKVSKNLKIILFNFPGQAYTLFSKTLIYNNEYNATLLDLFLNELYELGRIDILSENLRFIGLGSGGNVLAYFLILAENFLMSIRCALVVNSFIFVDDFLRKMLSKAKETFENTPKNLPDVAFQYFDITFGRRQLAIENAQSRCTTNPISIEGRRVIIDGILNSINLIQKIQTVRIPFIIIHSLQNNIVDVNHTYLFENTFEASKLKKDKEKVTISMFLKSQRRRLTLLCEGGYSLFDENTEEFFNYLGEFMTSPLSHNNTLQMIFIEKILNELEDSLLSIQERDVIECKNVIQKLKSFTSMEIDSQKRSLEQARKTSTYFNESVQKVQQKVDKTIENIDNLKNRMSKYELNEEITEKILQNADRRLADIKVHINTLIRIDQKPLNQLFKFAQIQTDIEDSITKLQSIIDERKLDRIEQRLTAEISSKNLLNIDRLGELQSERRIQYEAMRTIQASSKECSDQLDEVKSLELTSENSQGWLNLIEDRSKTLWSLILHLEAKLVALSFEMINFFVKTESVAEDAGAEDFFTYFYHEILLCLDCVKLQSKAQSIANGNEDADTKPDAKLESVTGAVDHFELKTKEFLQNNDDKISHGILSLSNLHQLNSLDKILGSRAILQGLIGRCKDVRQML